MSWRSLIILGFMWGRFVNYSSSLLSTHMIYITTPALGTRHREKKYFLSIDTIHIFRSHRSHELYRKGRDFATPLLAPPACWLATLDATYSCAMGIRNLILTGTHDEGGGSIAYIWPIVKQEDGSNLVSIPCVSIKANVSYLTTGNVIYWFRVCYKCTATHTANHVLPN